MADPCNLGMADPCNLGMADPCNLGMAESYVGCLEGLAKRGVLCNNPQAIGRLAQR
jgi:hypothetical protein